MIAVLGGLADVERDLIRTRTAEGRSRAQTDTRPRRRLGQGIGGIVSRLGRVVE
jgi:DNA invertase Pin-like site-specific DNA recombinase